MTYTGAWNKDFGEIISSGTISHLPNIFSSTSESNIYKLCLAFDHVIDRVNILQEHRNKGRSIEIPFDDNAIGEMIEELGKYFGLERIKGEPTDSFINRLSYHWGYFEGGGSSGSIKQTIYYFIGPEAFADSLDNTNAIIISNASGSGTQIYYWNRTPESKWGSGTTVYSYWSETEAQNVGFVIDIYLEYNDYTNLPQRHHYDYWTTTSGSYAEQSERNRIFLKKVIDSVKPLGKTYIIRFHGSTPPS